MNLDKNSKCNNGRTWAFWVYLGVGILFLVLSFLYALEEKSIFIVVFGAASGLNFLAAVSVRQMKINKEIIERIDRIGRGS